jgi:nitroreductase
MILEDPHRFADLVRNRRSIRDFRQDAIADDTLKAILADAAWSPSWSNTQPYRIAVAEGALRNRLRDELCAKYDRSMAALARGTLGKLSLWIRRDGLPDGDYDNQFEYPDDLLAKRRATGYGLYSLLGIDRKDKRAREAQMRRNFEFFGAPTVLFIFAHRGLREFSVLDAGILLQTLMLSASAHGVASCAQGALATWASPVKKAFDVPPQYGLIVGLALGYASDHPVNAFNPGRPIPEALLLKPSLQPQPITSS